MREGLVHFQPTVGMDPGKTVQIKEGCMKKDLAVFAALLHDVGKLAQRAGAPTSQGMDQEYCPHGSTHRHVLYTDYFIEHVLPLPPEMEALRGKLARMAAAHHRPDADSREERMLHLADCLSSGGDRMEGVAGGDYKSARLESVFSSVRLDGSTPESGEKTRRYRLSALDAADCPIFPLSAEQTGSKNSYAKLHEDFCAALEAIPLRMGSRHYLHSLVTVLERFTWCVPSSTYGTRADISLFDHSVTTAAITQALLACPANEERFLLFGADISGIQKFIFGVGGQADKGAGKLLRARSFLLQALTRSVWLILLERLQLSAVAKIMDAGGRFILLLPDTEPVHRTLDTLEDEVQHWLLEDFQGRVVMNFARLPLRPDDLKRERFVGCFERFHDALEQAKLHPFRTLFRDRVSPVLPVNHEEYRKLGECALCHACPASGPEKGDENVAACPQCRHLVRIGRQLPEARFLVFDRCSGGLPLFGGLCVRLEKERPQSGDALDIVSMRDRTAFSAVPVAGFVPVVSRADLSRWQKEGRLREEEGMPVLAGEPCREGTPKTFAVLAEEARIAPCTEGETWRSVACLAACKADVDNLGLLFGAGFGVGEESRFSLSRFAMLARMLNHFFASHLMHVIERDFPDIYVVFAGGDDLFVLGPWAETVRFAARLQEDFSAFSGNNPAITLSAGLAVVRPRLPVRTIREEAEKALEKSKAMPEKNAATLFGVSASWPEFHSQLKRGDWLEELCLKGHVTQGFVRRLLGYARDCRDFANGQIRKGLYLSHLAYDMARNCDEKKIDPEDMKKLKALGQDKENFPRAELSISWALYRTRISG